MTDRALPEQYSTSDPFLAAYLRLRSKEIVRIATDRGRSNRKRIYFDMTPEAGLEEEIRYRNSDFRKFAQLFNDTMDLLKRR